MTMVFLQILLCAMAVVFVGVMPFALRSWTWLAAYGLAVSAALTGFALGDSLGHYREFDGLSYAVCTMLFKGCAVFLAAGILARTMDFFATAKGFSKYARRLAVSGFYTLAAVAVLAPFMLHAWQARYTVAPCDTKAFPIVIGDVRFTLPPAPVFFGSYKKGFKYLNGFSGDLSFENSAGIGKACRDSGNGLKTLDVTKLRVDFDGIQSMRNGDRSFCLPPVKGWEAELCSYRRMGGDANYPHIVHIYNNDEFVPSSSAAKETLAYREYLKARQTALMTKENRPAHNYTLIGREYYWVSDNPHQAMEDGTPFTLVCFAFQRETEMYCSSTFALSENVYVKFSVHGPTLEVPDIAWMKYRKLTAFLKTLRG